MKERMKNRVLIPGGAGFIGSNLAEFYLDKGWHVTVIDGLLERTGARLQNLACLRSSITFINKRIEDIAELRQIIEQNDLVIDCMAWTSHRAAIADPLYDIDLNIKSHIYLINSIPEGYNKPVIYLGSRGQYGNPKLEVIDEETPMSPEDVQGINKLAAENYFRIYSKLKNFNVISVRFPNCYGKNQPLGGDDIGLIGSFIRDVLADKEIEIYGNNRKRFILYVNDLCEYIYVLYKVDISGFNSYNVSGIDLTLEELVETIIKLTGKGRYIKKEIPQEIKAIDIGTARFSDDKIKNLIPVQTTDIKVSLEETIKYFHQDLS